MSSMEKPMDWRADYVDRVECNEGDEDIKWTGSFQYTVTHDSYLLTH